MARSSSGLGHRPLKAGITGSNPVRATGINHKKQKTKNKQNSSIKFQTNLKTLIHWIFISLTNFEVVVDL